ncbi:MAG: FecR domain-containing protein [Rhodospirillales bacterium]
MSYVDSGRGAGSSETTGGGEDIAVLEAHPGQAVALPEGFSLQSAEFARQGPDLLLRSPDGQQILVKNFFAFETLPDLMSADGAMIINGAWAATLAGPAAPGQYAQAGPASGAAQPIGKVETIKGEATATRVDGTKVALQQGDPVFQGDTLETTGDGAVGLVFVDNTTFSMTQDARMVLDEMVFDASTNEGKMAFSLAKGVFSFVSGQIAKSQPDAMVLNSPVATIGIRGTDGAINLPDGTVLTVVIKPDAGGGLGEITVTNAAGVVVLNQPFQGSQIASLNAPPSQPFQMTAAEFNQTFGAALSARPPQPTSPPGQQGNQGNQGGEGQGGEGQGGEGQGEGQGQGGEGGQGQGGEGQGEQTAEGQGQGEGPGEFTGPLGDIAGLFGSQTFGEGSLFGAAGADLFAGLQAAEAELFANAPPTADFLSLARAIENVIVTQATEVFISQDTTTEFTETLTATTGDDTLVGGDGNTQFAMNQGSTLGGTDTVDGGAGTDELTLTNLSGFEAVWDLAGGTISYAFDGGSSTGSIAITSVEQIFANAGTGSITGISDADSQLQPDTNDAGTGVRLAIDESSGFGYLLAGDGLDNTLSAANGATLLSGGHTVVGASAFGALIFGGGGNDTITGTAVGDVIFGGDGDDIIDGGSVNAGDTLLDGDPDALFGGAGNDTFIIRNPASILTTTPTTEATGDPFGSFVGGAGIDTVRLGNISTPVTGQTYVLDTPNGLLGFASIEELYVEESDTTVIAENGVFLSGLDAIEVGVSVTNVTIKSSDATLNLSGVTTVDAGITDLAATDEGSGVTITDANDSNGRTLTGGANNDTLTGFGGADTLLGGDGDDQFIITGNGDIQSGEVITGGAGVDTLVAQSAVTTLDLSLATMTQVETINLSAASAAVTLTADAADLSAVTGITGSAASDTLVLTGSTDIGGIDLRAGSQLIETINFDSANAGAFTLTTNASRSYAGQTLTASGGDDTLASDNGLDLSGATATGFSAVSIDTGNTGTSTLTINGSTSIEIPTVNGGTDGDDLISITGGNRDIDGVTFNNIATITLAGAAESQTLVLDATTVLNGTDITGTQTGGSNDDHLTSEDSIDLSGVTLTNIASVQLDNDDSTDALTQAATLTINASTVLGMASIGGGSGNDDGINLGTAGGTFDFSNNILTDIATITGGAGDDTVTLGNAITGMTVDLGSHTIADTLNLANGTNSVTVAGIEFVNGGTGNDTIAATGTNVAGKTINAGAGTDTLQFTSGGSITNASFLQGITNFETWELTVDAAASLTLHDNNVASGQTLTIDASALTSGVNGVSVDGIAELDGSLTLIGGAGADTLTGGSGADILTGGAGADTLTGGAGSDTFIYNATGEFGDTITDFVAGASGDIIDFNIAVQGAGLEALATLGTIGAGTGIVNYTTDVANFQTASDVAIALNTLVLTNLTAGDDVLFAVGNGTDTRLWHWNDGTGGTADTIVEAAELTAVADLTGVDNNNLTADNFQGFS